MKKGILLFAVSISVGMMTNAQTFSDNFDAYTAGAYLGTSNSTWKTWANTPGGADDIKISNAKAHSGSNSLFFSSVSGGPADIVLPFGGQYNSGTLNQSMWIFVDAGKKAYFNFQEQTLVGKGWSFDVDFDSLGKVSIINTINGTLLTSTYTQNQWIKIEVNVDLNTNTWEFLIDNISKGIFQNSYRSVASLDIFSKAGSSFYVDDVSYTYTSLTKPVLDATVTYIDKVIGLLATQVALPVIEIRNLGTQAITSAKIELTYNGNTQTKDVSGLNIASLGVYPVTMDNPVTMVSGTKIMTVTVKQVNGVNDDNSANNTKSLTLNPIVPAVGKLVIAEEGTGTWCGWCPRGAVFLGTMDEKYHGLIQGIAVHNNDPMTYGNYDKGLAVSSYPTVKVDRLTGVDPSAIEGDFMTRVMVPPHAMIWNGAAYNSSTRELKVCLVTKFVQPVTGNYKIACVLVEDSVTGTTSAYNQSNYYAGGSKGVMGGFEVLPNPVPAAKMVYDHVGRVISPNFGGLPNAFSATVNAGDSFVHNFTFILDASWRSEKMHIVGMVIDPTGKIDNGSSVSFTDAVARGYVNGTVVLDVRQLSKPDNIIVVYPNPSNDQFSIKLNRQSTEKADLTIYDLQGKVVLTLRDFAENVIHVDASKWSSGLYLAEINQNGSIKKIKLIKE